MPYQLSPSDDSRNASPLYASNNHGHHPRFPIDHNSYTPTMKGYPTPIDQNSMYSEARMLYTGRSQEYVTFQEQAYGIVRILTLYYSTACPKTFHCRCYRVYSKVLGFTPTPGTSTTPSPQLTPRSAPPTTGITFMMDPRMKKPRHTCAKHYQSWLQCL